MESVIKQLTQRHKVTLRYHLPPLKQGGEIYPPLLKDIRVGMMIHNAICERIRVKIVFANSEHCPSPMGFHFRPTYRCRKCPHATLPPLSFSAKSHCFPLFSMIFFIFFLQNLCPAMGVITRNSCSIPRVITTFLLMSRPSPGGGWEKRLIHKSSICTGI